MNIVDGKNDLLLLPSPPTLHVHPERVEGLKIKCEYQTNYANWHNTPDGFPVGRVSTLRYSCVTNNTDAGGGLIATGLYDNRRRKISQEGNSSRTKRVFLNLLISIKNSLLRVPDTGESINRGISARRKTVVPEFWRDPLTIASVQRRMDNLGGEGRRWRIRVTRRHYPHGGRNDDDDDDDGS